MTESTDHHRQPRGPYERSRNNPKKQRTRLGLMLYQDRQASGLTQRQVAAAMSEVLGLTIDQSKISAYEWGETQVPARERLEIMAQLYGHDARHYVEMIDWANGSRMLENFTPPTAITFAEPSPEAARLLRLIKRVEDEGLVEPVQLTHVADSLEFIIEHADRS